jgi:nucleoside-diphosphate-sugar epimerase
MNKIGVAGARGQLGSSLMKVLGPTALELDRANSSMKSVDSMIWAAGSVNNRCTESEAEYELSSVQRVLASADSSPVSRIVLLSSGGTVYGNNGNQVKRENDDLRPETAYARLKVKVEQEFENFCFNRGISLIILRLANVFSSRGKGLISVLLKRALDGKPLELLVNPESRKQYGHSDDYANLIVRYLKEIPKDQIPKIFNLYAPNSYSVQEILTIARQYRDFDIESSGLASELPLNSIELSSDFPDFINSHNWLTLESFLEQELGGLKA